MLTPHADNFLPFRDFARVRLRTLWTGEKKKKKEEEKVDRSEKKKGYL